MGKRILQWQRITALLESAPIGYRLVHLHPEYEMLVEKIGEDRVQISSVAPIRYGHELSQIVYGEYEELDLI